MCHIFNPSQNSHIKVEQCAFAMLSSKLNIFFKFSELNAPKHLAFFCLFSSSLSGKIISFFFICLFLMMAMNSNPVFVLIDLFFCSFRCRFDVALLMLLTKNWRKNVTHMSVKKYNEKTKKKIEEYFLFVLLNETNDFVVHNYIHIYVWTAGFNFLYSDDITRIFKCTSVYLWCFV